MNINIRAERGTSFYGMSAGVRRVAEIVRQNPYIDSFMARSGGGGGFYGGGGGSNAQLQVNLTPRATRSVSAQQISQQLRRQLLSIPNFNVFVNLPSSLNIGARVGSSNYNVTVQSLNTDDLYVQAGRLSAAMQGIPEIQDVSNDL